MRLDNAPEGKTISALLEAGEIDGFIAPRPPTLVEKGHPHIGWLFPDPVAVAKDYYKRTGFFPIMHVVGVRRELAERHPWLPGAVLKAFEQSKQAGLAKLSDTSATKVTLPFVEERLAEARALMGHDFWSYGVEPNRKVLDYFLAQHHAEGLSERRVCGRRAVSPGDLRDVQAVVIPGRRKAASPESIFADGGYGFRARGLCPRPGMTVLKSDPGT